MILVDTGALYALVDKNDSHHPDAKKFYQENAGKVVWAISQTILTESWLLLEARLGNYFATKVWESVCDGVFELLEIDTREMTVQENQTCPSLSRNDRLVALICHSAYS